MSDSTALPLALTLGEPAGIGPDLTIQLWHRRVELRLPAFYLIADPEFIKRRARLLGLEVASSAPSAIASIQRAVADVLAGQAAAIVTNPVAKNVLYRSGFAEPGHTEFLAKLVKESTGKTATPVMMLWSLEL